MERQQVFAEAQGHHQAGRLEEAGRLYQSLLDHDPSDADACHYLGVLAYQSGDLNAAEARIRRAIEMVPDSPSMKCNLGLVLKDQGHLKEAEAAFLGAVDLAPGLVSAHNNLGLILLELDRVDDAEAALHKALELAPNNADAHHNLGNLLRRRGDFQAAEDAFRKAIDEQSNRAETWNNLGLTLMDQGRLDDGVEAFHGALARNPAYGQAHNNLGAALMDLGRLSEAEISVRQALEINPNSAPALTNLGNCLKNQGRINEATTAMRKALTIAPDSAITHSSLIFLLDDDPSLDLAAHQEERRRWAEAHAHSLAPRIRTHDNDPDPERRLRIGYVSADFRRHSAASAFGPVLFNHDHEHFEFICYSGVIHEDDLTARFRAKAIAWRDVRGLTDDELAEQIRGDNIDILVDLSGHSAGHRLLAFARKPAPVQVSGWGHGTGTGLAAIDYLISDPVMVRGEERSLFAEVVADLPCNFLYMPPDKVPPVAPLPAETAGYVTFGCFNRREKISAQSIELWSEILGAVPESRLLLKASELSDEKVCAALKDGFAAHGIAEDRLVLKGRTSQYAHLDAYGQIDIALDPFPHSGGISTAEALWMGAPVVTLLGRSISGRNAASILTAVGLDEFIAEDPRRYRDIAVTLARDIEKLGEFRAALRERAARSPLGDITAYVQAVETAYRGMWRRKCDEAHSRPGTDMVE